MRNTLVCLTLKMRTLRAFETVISTYPRKQRKTSEDPSLQRKTLCIMRENFPHLFNTAWSERKRSYALHYVVCNYSIQFQCVY
jgi:hypothetical protein